MPFELTGTTLTTVSPRSSTGAPQPLRRGANNLWDGYLGMSLRGELEPPRSPRTSDDCDAADAYPRVGNAEGSMDMYKLIDELLSSPPELELALGPNLFWTAPRP